MAENRSLKEIITDLTNVISRVGQRQLMKDMNETGLSHSQMITITRLYNHAGGGISAMGAHMGTSDAAASQLIERLVNLGLVERIECSEDRRKKQVALTSKGRLIVERMIERREETVTRTLAEIPLEKQHLIVESAEILAEAARKFEQELDQEESNGSPRQHRNEVTPG